MNEYIVKIDNNYYAGDKIYTIRGYMDKKHPSKTIKLTRYDFKALAVDDYEDAVEIKERCKKLGEKIEIYFYEFLRKEQKFERFDHLKEQLKLDKKTCEEKDY